MSTTLTPARDAKLAQYLSEAYGNEKRLETALEAHIGLTTRAPYKRRLRQHLTETKRHATAVERRMKQLGGSSEPVPGPLGGAAEAALAGAQKATALAQGPLHALRGTGEQERELKNAKSEYAEEAQEIGMYAAIEALAQTVGDKDTERLAKAILRDERRMLTFLEREIPRLSVAVAKAEIPAAQRNGAATRRKAKRRTGATATRRKATRATGTAKGSRARSGSGRSASRTGSARRAGSTRRTATTRRSGAKAGATRSSRASSARASSRRSAASRSTSGTTGKRRSTSGTTGKRRSTSRSTAAGRTGARSTRSSGSRAKARAVATSAQDPSRAVEPERQPQAGSSPAALPGASS